MPWLQGFGKELFTDAGKYIIHYGLPPERAAEVATTTVQTRSEGKVRGARWEGLKYRE